MMKFPLRRLRKLCYYDCIGLHLISYNGCFPLPFHPSGARLLSGFSALAPRTLDAILNLDSVKNASPEDLKTLWSKSHTGRGVISAVMRKELFDTLQHRAKDCPLFVIPLQKGNGYVSFFLQAQMPNLLFTGLEDYKVRGSEASPYFTVAHYSELAASKGLVLVRGDVVFSNKMNDVEAKQLLELSHSFFLDDSRYKLVQQFNRQSGEFEFKEVLRELGLPSGN